MLSCNKRESEMTPFLNYNMRQDKDARIILVNKAKLIDKIKENKVKHQEEYAKAVDAYKLEAKEQLEDRLTKLAAGDTKLQPIHLISPVDSSAEYDKLVEMFEWELKEEVELSQGEFNEYIFNETSFARSASVSNLAYQAKFR